MIPTCYVNIEGKVYALSDDGKGALRFKRNTVSCYLFESGQVDLNRMRVDYEQGKFAKRDYAEFVMGLGYTLSGFEELSAFQDWQCLACYEDGTLIPESVFGSVKSEL